MAVKMEWDLFIYTVHSNAWPYLPLRKHSLTHSLLSTVSLLSVTPSSVFVVPVNWLVITGHVNRSFYLLIYYHKSNAETGNQKRPITAVLRSFLLATFPPLLQFLVGIGDILKSCHELLNVVKALVQHLLPRAYAQRRISVSSTTRLMVKAMSIFIAAIHETSGYWCQKADVKGVMPLPLLGSLSA